MKAILALIAILLTFAPTSSFAGSDDSYYGTYASGFTYEPATQIKLITTLVPDPTQFESTLQSMNRVITSWISKKKFDFFKSEDKFTPIPGSNGGFIWVREIHFLETQPSYHSEPLDEKKKE